MLGIMWYSVGYVKEMIAVPSEVDVPDVVNMTLDQAKQELASRQLEALVEYLESSDVPKDVVIRQNPSGMKVRPGYKVTLYVSEGPAKQKMPEVVKLKLSDAKERLTKWGIKPENISVDPQFMDEEPDTVVTQTPGPGEEFTDPSAVMVKLIVSKGPETFKMPNLIGKTENEARNMVMVNNLKLSNENVSYEASYKQTKGRVIEQFPYQPGDEVSPGAEIKLIVSSGFPEEAGPMSVPVTIKPTSEGKLPRSKSY